MWFKIQDDSDVMLVPGGLLIRSSIEKRAATTGNNSCSIAQSFVPCLPDVAKQWVEENSQEYVDYLEESK